MGALHDFLRAGSRDGLVPLALHRDAVIRFGLADADVEDAILSLGFLPERYLRNTRTISRAEQLRLFRSHVAVVGCGGLGGYVTEELCRIGVGTLTVIDPDVFEAHNLNRQLHATLASLGEPKVEAVRRRTGGINPAVTIITRRMSLSRENGQELLAGANLAVDALDSIPARIELAGACERLNIPLVHGSVGGWYGQVTVQYPGDRTLEKLYAGCTADKGVEQDLGTPPFSPALVASIEVSEAIKILLGQGATLRHTLLSIDLLDLEFALVPVAP